MHTHRGPSHGCSTTRWMDLCGMVSKKENGRGGTTGFKRFPGSNACVPALATKAGVHAAHQHLQFIRMDFDHLPDLFCSCFPG